MMLSIQGRLTLGIGQRLTHKRERKVPELGYITSREDRRAWDGIQEELVEMTITMEYNNCLEKL